MARDPAIDARLQRWAEYLQVGDGSGYPVKCTLHEDWSPPSPGTLPTMKVTPSTDARETDRIVHRMSDRMRATVVAVYVLRMPLADAAVALDCQPDTVLDRVERAHRFIERELGSFCNIQQVG